MATSKFGGIPVDEARSAGGQFGGEPVSYEPAQVGAAFGIYPKQRATPSRPETREAMRQFAEKTGGVLGFGVPEEPEMSPGAVGAATGIGAAAGAAGPSLLKGAGRVLSAVPYTRGAGALLQALGTGMQAVPASKRAAAGGAALGGTELTGQLGEQVGIPRAVTAPATLLGVPAAAKGAARTLLGTPTRTSEQYARAAEELGFKLSPAQVRADIPIPAKGATGYAEANQTLANELASAGTGAKASEISADFIGSRLKKLGAEYDKLYKGKQFAVDQNVVGALQNILIREQELGPAGVSTVKQAAQTMLENIQAKGLTVTGDDLQRLRNALTERARSTSSRGNAHEIYELVDVIDKSVGAKNPAFKAVLDDLRPKYRNTIILEDLYRRGGIKQGNISLEQLGTMLQGKRDVVRRAGRDIDNLGDLGRELGLRARWETEGRAATAGEDLLGKVLGTGADITGTLTGTRSAPARAIQRFYSE